MVIFSFKYLKTELLFKQWSIGAGNPIIRDVMHFKIFHLNVKRVSFKLGFNC